MGRVKPGGSGLGQGWAGLGSDFRRPKTHMGGLVKPKTQPAPTHVKAWRATRLALRAVTRYWLLEILLAVSISVRY